MTYARATALAKTFNSRNDGKTYEASRQYWRDGKLWYIHCSDGSGIFNANM